MRLFTLCTYLKTKESYDRWITRRVWGFRQQISKAKYPKMSVGNIRKLQENTAALYTERKTLRVSAIRGSGYVYPEKLKRPPLPSGCEISGCKMSAHGILGMKCRRTEFRMWNVDGRNSGYEMSAHRQAIRINSIRIPQENMWRALLSGLPQGEVITTQKVLFDSL